MARGVQVTEDVGWVIADDSCEHGGGGVDLVDVDRVAFVNVELLPVDDSPIGGLVDVHGLAIDGDGDFTADDLMAGGQRTGKQSAW